MTAFPSRDCYVLKKGDAFAVSVTASLAAQGWLGGQGVNWEESTKDEFLVGAADGRYGGFLVWGSNEVADQYVSLSAVQPTYGFAVFGMGSWVVSTSTYEKYTYASRLGGPLVPISYSSGDRLLFSLRGYWTKEDEWSLSADPRAPNRNYIGFVVQEPSVFNNNQLTLQTAI